eukprot:g5639.t1
MVSLTFDEFHAIRSRQRASAEAEASAVAAKTSSEHAPSGSFASGKLVDSKTEVVATRKAAPSRKSSKRSEPSSSAASPSPTGSRGRSNGASDGEIAPTSGSRVVRKKQQLRADKTSGSTSGLGGARGVGSVANLGRFVELYEVQVAVVAMIYLDLVASTAQLLPYFQAAEDETDGRAGAAEGVAVGSRGNGFGAFALRLVSRLMHSFTGFTIIFFAIEVAMLLAAFGRRFFRHLGYVVDLLVVSACLYQEMAGKGKGVRLLGALRVWRVARVINTLLLSADKAHDETRDTLRMAEKTTQNLETDRRRLQETLRREVEARKRVDRMLKGYKDEVETLNEALKIAAMDIAAAGVSPGMGTGDGDNTIKRSADVDTGSSESAGSQGSDDASGKNGTQEQEHLEQPTSGRTASRIFVFQDGTFQAR